MKYIVTPGESFLTETSMARFKLSGAAIAISGGVATVTLASHLMTTGDYVTFSGITGVTAMNNATWGPVTVTASNTYTFPTALTGSPAGTIVQEPLIFMPGGDYLALLGANGQLEYNPDNTGYPGGGYLVTAAQVWRIFMAASAAGFFSADGQAVRFRCNGTTATSNWSQYT
jgi:hypothetical protein